MIPGVESLYTLLRLILCSVLYLCSTSTRLKVSLYSIPRSGSCLSDVLNFVQDTFLSTLFILTSTDGPCMYSPARHPTRVTTFQLCLCGVTTRPAAAPPRRRPPRPNAQENTRHAWRWTPSRRTRVAAPLIRDACPGSLHVSGSYVYCGPFLYTECPYLLNSYFGYSFGGFVATSACRQTRRDVGRSLGGGRGAPKAAARKGRSSKGAPLAAHPQPVLLSP